MDGAGRGYGGDLCALSALAAHRRDVRGLHSHRAGEGAHGAAGDLAPRGAERDHPHRHPAGPRRRRAAGRQRDPHRVGVQHPRNRQGDGYRDWSVRPSADPGDRAVRRLLHSHLQPHRRHPLRLPGPSGAVPVSLLEVQDLKVHFETDDGVVKAVDGVSFAVEQGRTLGIVGESGCGKSVANLTILGLTRAPNARISGRISFEGRDLLQLDDEGLREVRGDEIAMVFQDPLSSLHPLYRVGDQLVEAIQAHRDLSAGAARERAIELLGEVGIPNPKRRVDDYPHEFSGGMRQRAMIAMALANERRLLIADEPTTALDVTTQAQILTLIDRLQVEHEMAVILITHDLGVVAENADDIAVMYAGRIVERAGTEDVFA